MGIFRGHDKKLIINANSGLRAQEVGNIFQDTR
jgi:hypothetical protein